MTKFSLLLAALALAAAPLTAATLAGDERDAPGGDFSDRFDQPSTFGAGVLTVTGRQNSPRDSDFLKFEGFAEGAERLDFVVTNPGGTWGHFNLRIKQAPFAHAGDWWPLALFQDGTVTDATPLAFSFSLGGHSGPLYLAFDFNDADFLSGDGLRYQISQAGAGLSGDSLQSGDIVAVSAIPLPPAGFLLLAGVGALAVLRRRRGA